MKIEIEDGRMTVTVPPVQGGADQDFRMLKVGRLFGEYGYEPDCILGSPDRRESFQVWGYRNG